MGVHCDLTELGINTMAVKSLAVFLSLSSLTAAEPGYGYGYGHATSYTHRSPQGLHGGYGGYGYGGYYGKREAEAEPGYGYGGYGSASVYVSQADHGYGYSPAHYSYGYNIGGYGKREAEAEPGYGYGAVSYHPYGGSSSVYRSTQGLTGGYGYSGYYGKRDADAEPGYGYGGYGYGGYGYGHATSYSPGTPWRIWLWRLWQEGG